MNFYNLHFLHNLSRLTIRQLIYPKHILLVSILVSRKVDDCGNSSSSKIDSPCEWRACLSGPHPALQRLSNIQYLLWQMNPKLWEVPSSAKVDMSIPVGSKIRVCEDSLRRTNTATVGNISLSSSLLPLFGYIITIPHFSFSTCNLTVSFNRMCDCA